MPSNRFDVDQNVPEDIRYDVEVMRNGGRAVTVTLKQDDVPIDLTGATIEWKAKTNYQAQAFALTIGIDQRADTSGSFRGTIDASKARGVGVDVEDLVHDLKVTPSGGGVPTVYLAGLIVLRKGVS